MRLVNCPDKDDYCRSNSILPNHPLVTKMTHSRFRYISRYIHMEEKIEINFNLQKTRVFLCE